MLKLMLNVIIVKRNIKLHIMSIIQEKIKMKFIVQNVAIKFILAERKVQIGIR